MKRNTNTKSLVILGLMTALLIIFSFTPIGTIPIAIAAAALGPAGGAAMGAVFGLLSFLQCIGIGIPSGMGAVLFSINPFLAFVQRFVPRLLDGFLVGLIFRGCEKHFGYKPAGFVTGFFSAFLNTLFFMTALIVLFGNTEYVQGLMGGKNVILFVCTFVGVNAVVEMLVSTIVTGGVVMGLYKAQLLPISAGKRKQGTLPAKPAQNAPADAEATPVQSAEPEAKEAEPETKEAEPEVQKAEPETKEAEPEVQKAEPQTEEKE